MDALDLNRVLELDEFTPHLDEPFRLPLEGGDALELTLTEAEYAAPGPPAEGFRRPVSLLFRGPAEPLLPQRLYALEHPALGRFALFLVALGPEAGGMRYEAILG